MKLLSAALLGVVMASSAQAVEFTQLDSAATRISFNYQQMGVSMDGRFRKFNAQLAFDPAKPEKAKVAFDVDLLSVDTGSSEADQEVAGKAWFNSKLFPTARFVATRISPLGGNRYQVQGQLSIKGKTQELSVPATFTSQGNSASFDGAFTLRRGDFAIGEGSWAKFDIVANDIQVKFHIQANK